ncbi:MAG TPA: methyltransferase [Caulobacteraceae bacterium]|jgi:tRNA1(Val) A37 N6-methylase TrmN6|nr:methyltransferase [Caulobacteraceae bacterium]
MTAAAALVTVDRMLGGRLVLRQPAKGYRAGLDAALLAAACDAAPGEAVLDAGCGVGAVMLAAALRRPGASFTGIERDPVALALALRNIAANGLEERARAIAGDIGVARAKPPARYDAALSNPPYFDDRRALRGPDPAKAGAFIADDGLGAWIAYLLRAVRDGGTVTVVHRAERLADLLALLSAKAGTFQVRPVHPHADEPAGRVLVRAVRGGRAPLRLLPPLVLHERGGAKHMPQAEAILRGEAGLPWL